jgi:hypothetical protein
MAEDRTRRDDMDEPRSKSSLLEQGILGIRNVAGQTLVFRNVEAINFESASPSLRFADRLNFANAEWLTPIPKNIAVQVLGQRASTWAARMCVSIS